MTQTIELIEVSKKTKAWACYDCGKCTANCPITRVGGIFSPRRRVLATSLGERSEISADEAIFTCLTCKMCDERCPVGVDYTQMIRDLREIASYEGREPECPHGGALQSAMRMMARGVTKQNRLGWLTDDLKTDPEKGEVFFFTGCAMYYDAFFPEFKLNILNGTRAGIKILNRLGITPVVSPDERCCGHDLLWNGDRANFELLAKHNVELVKRSEAKVLVTPCAECTRTWRIDYAPFYAGKPLKVVHLSEFLCDKVQGLRLRGNQVVHVTYQDPCRLGRHLKVYDAPREILRAIPGVEIWEMPRSRNSAVCCAGSTWSNCDRYAKKIQVQRLREARATGAALLVTACPKCQIHLACAMQDPNLKDEIQMPMKDVTEILAESLEDEKG